MFLKKIEYVASNKELMKDWNYKKNISLNPNKISIGSHKKVWWKCKNCGCEWESEIRIRKDSYGCPYCSKEQKSKDKMKRLVKLNGSLFDKKPELIDEWDYTKNSNFDPKTIVYNSSKDVWWICSTCGHNWHTKLYHRTQTGTGCPKCAQSLKSYNINVTLMQNNGSLEENNPELAKEWHPTKNGKLKPSDVMLNYNKKVWWICSKGHEYQSSPNNRNKPTGCPICKSEKQTSIPEKIIYYYIKKVFPNAIQNYKEEFLGKRELDIFIPDINLAIEYDGEAWHRNIKKDIIKSKLCSDNNITLIRFREPKCPKLQDSSIIYELKSNINDNNNMNEPIKWLVNYINEKYKMGILLDINVEKDYSDILSTIEMYEKENSIENLFPELMKEYDYKKNVNVLPSQLSAGSHKMVWWICKEKHSYQTRVSTRVRGEGCPECAKKSRVINRQKTYLKQNGSLYDNNYDLLDEWDYQKNKDIDPKQITSHSHKKVWWKCKNCGYEWMSTIDNRVKGQGCLECGKKRSKEKRIKNKINQNGSLKDKFPTIAQEWNYKRNIKILPEDFLSSSNKKVWWKCKNCGCEWESTIALRTKGYGKCPNCKE